jgi:hypothetical protein
VIAEINSRLPAHGPPLLPPFDAQRHSLNRFRMRKKDPCIDYTLYYLDAGVGGCAHGAAVCLAHIQRNYLADITFFGYSNSLNLSIPQLVGNHSATGSRRV